MKKFVFTAEVEIEAEDEDDARMELIGVMDEHNICWEFEEQSNG